MKILQIQDLCTGCTACSSICPSNCISIQPNDEGFFYPFIDEINCTNCHLCETVCPMFHQPITKQEPIYFYGWSKSDEIRRLSSSGGVFTAFADETIKDNGFVFGVEFDFKTKEVLHSGYDDSRCYRFRKSKYVESDLKDTLVKVITYLTQGRKVLFTGTPCQVDGLIKLLKVKDVSQKNLLTLDFICHGVPSQKIFREHLYFLEKHYKSQVRTIDFRPKSFGWSEYLLKIQFVNGRTYLMPYKLDIFFKGFMESYFLRKSCSDCIYKKNHSSDVTVADFWGYKSYNERVNDEKGLSLILINSDKGFGAISRIKHSFNYIEIDSKYAEYVLKKNSLDSSMLFKHNSFFQLYKQIGYSGAAKKLYFKWNYLNRISYLVKYYLKIYLKKRKA